MHPKDLVKSAYYKLGGVDIIWRYLFNARPTREYRSYRPQMCAESTRLLDSIDATGIAVSHVDNIPGLTERFEQMYADAVRIETEVNARLAAKYGRSTTKTHIPATNLLGTYPRFEPTSAFARFTTHPVLLNVINGYMGMFSQLRKYAIFRNTSAQDGVNSRWHRDAPYDQPIVRVFAYLAAVDEKSGPFHYAAGTHSKSPGGSRCVIAEAELERRAISCTGGTGTLVIADTRGYHRAGTFAGGERWLYNSVFTSPGFGMDSFVREAVRVPRPLDPEAWALASPLPLQRNFFY